jgi:hypothetical protein
MHAWKKYYCLGLNFLLFENDLDTGSNFLKKILEGGGRRLPACTFCYSL